MRMILLLLSLALPLAANAELVEIQWSGGAFSHKGNIAPKKFLEVCGKFKMGDTVSWQFKGSASSDFNIHYHAGNEAIYPENRKALAAAEGRLAAPLDQHYCWMWSNRSSEAIEIDLTLNQVSAGR